MKRLFNNDNGVYSAKTEAEFIVFLSQRAASNKIEIMGIKSIFFAGE